MKTGQIKMIQPTAEGGYQSQNGYINTFMMTIEVQGEGQITGEIGSKSTPYPKNVGEEITFEMKNTAHGFKFKKVNPQYAQGGSQGGGQAQGGQNSGGRDYDAENRGKCRTQFIKAGIQSGQMKCETWGDVKMFTDFAMTGVIPPERQTQAPTGDEIPF